MWLLCLVAFAGTRARAQSNEFDGCLGGLAACPSADVDWQYRDALFGDVMLDTGWIPSSAPIQLRLALLIGGSTEIDMGGRLDFGWPVFFEESLPGIDLSVVGRPMTGRLAINYGIELIARLRFDIEVAGVHYRWEGNIPIPGGIPRDLRLASETAFDPLLLPGAMGRPVHVSDTTERIRVVTYDALGGFIPIPGIGGGVALDLEGSLAASYATDRIAIDDSLPIESEAAHTALLPGEEGFGPALDLATHPEGTVHYDGAITLYPTLFIEIAGRHVDFTVAEIPVRIVDSDTNAVFDAATTHVPLPDVSVSTERVGLGEVSIGDSVSHTIEIGNDGEAVLEVTSVVEEASFDALPATLLVPPNTIARLAVIFAPRSDGVEEGTLLLVTNDPDEAIVSIELTGEGVEDPLPVADAGVDAGSEPSPGGVAVMDGGCGCSMDGRFPRGLLCVVAAGALLASLRRRLCATSFGTSR